MEQEFEDFEVIVSDNASTDGTGDICRWFAKKDCRVRYFRNEVNIGLAANHNRTFWLARGQFFKWAAHDDEYPPQMLARFVDVLEGSPRSVGVVYSRCEYIDEMGRVQGVDSDGVNKDDPRPFSRLAQCVWHVRVYNSIYGLIRSDLLRKTRLHGCFPGSDYVLLSELAMLGQFVELQDPVLRIRRHAGRTFTVNKSERALRELFSPGQGDKVALVSVRMRMECELIRSAVVVPPGLKDKVLCTAVAFAVPQWKHLKAFGGRQKRRLMWWRQRPA